MFPIPQSAIRNPQSEVLLSCLQVAGFDDQCVAFDLARQADRVAAAVNFVDLRRMKMQAAVVAHHVVAFLMVTLLGVITGVAGVERGAVNAVRTLEREETHLRAASLVVVKLGGAAQLSKRDAHVTVAAVADDRCRWLVAAPAQDDKSSDGGQRNHQHKQPSLRLALRRRAVGELRAFLLAAIALRLIIHTNASSSSTAIRPAPCGAANLESARLSARRQRPARR